jgi:hypothetical protein
MAHSLTLWVGRQQQSRLSLSFYMRARCAAIICQTWPRFWQTRVTRICLIRVANGYTPLPSPLLQFIFKASLSG